MLELEVRRVWEENFRVSGARKVWRQLNREQILVAKCTTERLMRKLGIRGVVRGKGYKTTIPDLLAERPADLAERKFTALHRNQLWVADITYVATWRGVVYNPMYLLDASSAGVSGTRCERTWFWMHLSRRCTRGLEPKAWCITAIAAASICPSVTPNVLPRPASSHQWGVSATRTITRWPKASSGCIKRQ